MHVGYTILIFMSVFIIGYSFSDELLALLLAIRKFLRNLVGLN